MVRGNCGRRLTSRATLGTVTFGTTCPKITSSTSEPGIPARESSSRVANRAIATGPASRNTVPAFANGVRTPATMTA